MKPFLRILPFTLCLMLILTVLPPIHPRASTDDDLTLNDQGTVTNSGTCGDNLTWELYSDGTLHISGTGEMYDYNIMEDFWNSLDDPNAVFVTCPWGYNVKKAVIHDGVTRIGSAAFEACHSLTDVTLPDSVTSIGQYAFYNCSVLSNVLLPEGLVSIEFQAFVKSGLTEIAIPKSVTEIYSWAFNDCSKLKFVSFHGAAPKIVRVAFDSGILCGVTATVHYPDNDPTWADVEKGYYGGTLTWAPHQYDDCVYNQDATCTQNGTTTGMCSCGAEGTLIVPDTALGHSYDSYNYNNDAGCLTDGTKSATCFRCGVTDTVTDEGTALGHSFTDYISDGNATCTQDGTKTRYCSMCGTKETVADHNTATGHSYASGFCTVCGEEDPNLTLPVLTLKSPTLEFKDVIRINAFFTAENLDDVEEMGMITYKDQVSQWSVQTADYVIPGAEYVDGGDRYYASSQGIHAKYLSETIYLAIYARLTDGSYVYTKLAPYSPLTYAKNQLKFSNNMALKQLVVAMLNYGAKAQMFFEYNVESLADASLTEDQKLFPEAYRTDMVETVPAVLKEKQGEFVNNKGFAKRTPSISFEGAFCINYFFTPNYTPVDGIALYYWKEEAFNNASVLTAENASGFFKLEGSGTGQYTGDIKGIAAKELSEAVYVAAVYSDGTTTWTSGVLGYSIGSYCSSQVSKVADVADLAMATAVYGYHAKQYFG